MADSRFDSFHYNRLFSFPLVPNETLLRLCLFAFLNRCPGSKRLLFDVFAEAPSLSV
ncbi:unnamed protein product [Protopolystoma xenopodis]|uniref:Uncharacterized protein n=1 Tax=Protopolystoma xenopodis TaxID=117903 RepID=A0A3S4ZN68_9PLAT|nr:unnamed protein product [Protopolystoma xenopodis]